MQEPIWEPEDLQSDRYKEIREHWKKNGRDWDSMEFVEKYLAGYLVLINMNVQSTRSAISVLEKTDNRKINAIKDFTKEVRKLNEKMEVLETLKQLPLELNLLKLRTEKLINTVSGGETEMYSDRISKLEAKLNAT